MSWPKKDRKAIMADVIVGIKGVKAIAADHDCSLVYVYGVISDCGYMKQFVTREEWDYIKAWRANRARNRATSPDAAKPLVGPVNGSTGKARRASDNARLAQTIG